MSLHDHSKTHLLGDKEHSELRYSLSARLRDVTVVVVLLSYIQNRTEVVQFAVKGPG